jgi:hypothetical protein
MKSLCLIIICFIVATNTYAETCVCDAKISASSASRPFDNNADNREDTYHACVKEAAKKVIGLLVDSDEAEKDLEDVKKGYLTKKTTAKNVRDNLKTKIENLQSKKELNSMQQKMLDYYKEKHVEKERLVKFYEQQYQQTLDDVRPKNDDVAKTFNLNFDRNEFFEFLNKKGTNGARNVSSRLISATSKYYKEKYSQDPDNFEANTESYAYRTREKFKDALKNDDDYQEQKVTYTKGKEKVEYIKYIKTPTGVKCSLENEDRNPDIVPAQYCKALYYIIFENPVESKRVNSDEYKHHHDSEGFFETCMKNKHHEKVNDVMAGLKKKCEDYCDKYAGTSCSDLPAYNSMDQLVSYMTYNTDKCPDGKQLNDEDYKFLKTKKRTYRIDDYKDNSSKEGSSSK